MKQRIIALAAALVLALSVFAATAVAGNGEKGPVITSAAPGGLLIATRQEPSPAGPDTAAQKALIVPDALGSVSFSNIESRVREKNLTVLTIQQSVDTLRDIDYAEMQDDLRGALNEIVDQRWNMRQLGGLTGETIGTSVAMNSMQQQYDALKETYDDLKEGKLQKDNEALIHQLQSGQDQVVMAAEATFVALCTLEVQAGALQRQLSALNRTVEEMELRHQMGQISTLQLAQVKLGRSQLISGLETLKMNISSYKTQLENLLGAELSGAIALGAVPEVTDAQLAAMDQEKDLAAAKAASYELYAAAETLAEAEDTYKDEAREYNSNEKEVEFRNAKRTWQAAQYTYNDTVQGYELRFRTLFAQVKDCKQVLEAAKVNLACQKETYAAAQLRQQQGTISKNALLTEADNLKAAEDTVQTAANDLFSAYNNYCWAVQRGILN